MNVLKPHERAAVFTLLENEVSQHEIHRKTGIDRKTIRRYQREWEGSKSPMATGEFGVGNENPPPWPPDGEASKAKKIPKQAMSACHFHREWIEEQVRLGRNAVSIYQDLVEQWGFSFKYNSVKRFVRGLRAKAPERFDVLEFLPGEEAQVDYGQGAWTLHPKTGKYKKPYLFVMTLRYSRKSFRKVVWRTSQEIWSKLHEEAFKYFGGCPQYVVLDNLKEGVIKPDFYEPGLNPVYSSVLAHYGVVGDPCRVSDPNRKGSVENAIQHTQGTALKGRRFETIEKQNEWLLHWEERWASARIHGKAKRQVEQMFLEEKPHLKPLPLEVFRYFEQAQRTVDDTGMIQVKGSFYSSLPAQPGSRVMVRIFERDVEVYDLSGCLVRRHYKTQSKGQYQFNPEDRLFNPSRETTRLMERASKIGTNVSEFCSELFKVKGRIGQKAIYGIVNLTRHHRSLEIDEACAMALRGRAISYQAVKKILERRMSKPVEITKLKQVDQIIRPLRDYQTFFDIQSDRKEGKNDLHQ